MDTHWEKCLDPRSNNLKKRKPWQREVGVTGVFRKHGVVDFVLAI